MKLTPIASVLAAVALFFNGGVASAAAAPLSTETIGSAPVIDAPGPDALPSLLGTVIRLSWCHIDALGDASPYESLIQPSSVITAGVTEQSRLVQVAVRFHVVSGSLLIDPSDFFLIDADGVRYTATTPTASDDVAGLPDIEPMIKDVLLPESGTVERAFYASVPIRTAGLVIGYDPSPADDVAGTWTLSAP